jgi:hypothetical protein
MGFPLRIKSRTSIFTKLKIPLYKLVARIMKHKESSHHDKILAYKQEFLAFFYLYKN